MYCLLLLVAAEFLLKAFFPSKIPPLDNQLPPYYYALSTNPRMGYELRPLTATINSDGLRDIEHSVEKKPGTIRILVVGDSIAYAGPGVSLENTYARKLEHILNRTGTDFFEVINLGVPGYGTAQIYERFIEKGLKYSPDIVVYGYWFTDHTTWGCGVHEYPFFTANFAAVWESYVRTLKKYPAIEKFRDDILRSELLLRLSHFLYIIRQKSSQSKEANGNIPSGAIKWKVRYDELIKQNKKIAFFESYKDQAGFYDYVRAFSNLTHMCKKRNIRFILLTTPVITDYDSYAYSGFHDYVDFIADRLDIERVDTLAAFQKVGAQSVRLSENDKTHFNATGHELVANALSAYILATKED